MIKEKFSKFLLWFKDHFRFLLEVVIRLSVGIREEMKNHDKFDERSTKDDK